MEPIHQRWIGRSYTHRFGGRRTLRAEALGGHVQGPAGSETIPPRTLNSSRRENYGWGPFLPTWDEVLAFFRSRATLSESPCAPSVHRIGGASYENRPSGSSWIVFGMALPPTSPPDVFSRAEPLMLFPSGADSRSQSCDARRLVVRDKPNCASFQVSATASSPPGIIKSWRASLLYRVTNSLSRSTHPLPFRLRALPNRLA